MRRTIRILFREPLTHFVLLGALLFAIYSKVAPPKPNHLVVPADFVAALSAEHKDRTGRAPTPAEVEKLVDRFVSEELLYREALSQGLDRGDMIVRRRLVQKMELLAKALVAEPSEADLNAHLLAHAERYKAAKTISFRHVFVSRERFGEGASAKAIELMTALRNGENPLSLGDPFLQGTTFARKTEAELLGTFGPSFAKTVLDGPEKQWFGPVQSSFGEHLVFIDEAQAEAPATLAKVFARLREDLLSERRDSAVEAEVLRLRKRYKVEVEGGSLQ